MIRVLPLLCLVACANPRGVETGTSAPELGQDASLARLRVSNDSLQPTFDPDRRLFAAKEGEDLRVVAVPNDPLATVELVVTDGWENELDRIPEGDVRMDLVGEQLLFAEVTSADGTVTERTRITVLPWDFPRLEVESTDPGPGYYFTTNMAFAPGRVGLGRFRMVLDNTGVPWRVSRMDGIAFDYRAQPGDITSWVELGQEALYGVRRGPTGERLPEVHAVDAVGDPHEFTMLDNGNTVFIGGRVTVRDMTAWGGPADAEVLDQVVQEIAPDGGLVFEWDARGETTPDDVPSMAVDWTSDEPVELSHVNSVEVDPHDGNWMISLRLPSRVVKVDRTTGDVLWRLGGTRSDFAFPDDARDHGWTGFAWQHSARVTGPDRILVFDNATNPDLPGPTGDTRYVEYQLDHGAMTATVVDQWSVVGSGRTDAGGNVQRLPDGNTLLGLGNLGSDTDWPSFVEVNPEGQVVFELRLTEDLWSYRTWKLDRDENGWVIPEP